MSRWLAWLSELQPETFCEVSPELAGEIGLKNGGWATLRTARAEIEARVLVTNRLRPLRLNGRVIHQIGMPYHWSSKGLVRGDCRKRADFRSWPTRTWRSWKPKPSPVMIEPGRKGVGAPACNQRPDRSRTARPRRRS